MKNQKKNYPTLTENLKETLEGLGKVIDNKETMREFNKLQYETPKVYNGRSIKRLREKTLRMSQNVFAHVCNIKLSTLQKWENGVNKPTPPMFRLFQLIERNGLSLIEK